MEKLRGEDGEALLDDHPYDISSFDGPFGPFHGRDSDEKERDLSPTPDFHDDDKPHQHNYGDENEDDDEEALLPHSPRVRKSQHTTPLRVNIPPQVSRATKEVTSIARNVEQLFVPAYEKLPDARHKPEATARPPKFVHTNSTNLPKYDPYSKDYPQVEITEETFPSKPLAYIETNIYIKLLCGLPAFAAGSLYLFMLIYFFYWYLKQPRVDGQLPRISPHYGAWPYVSNVGGRNEPVFRGVSSAVAVCVITSFCFDYYLGKDIKQGIWWRRAKTVCGFVTSSFLVALAFENVNVSKDAKKHLIFTSVHIGTAVIAKFCDFMLGFYMRRIVPNYQLLNVIRRWKKLAGLTAGPCVVMFMIGVYGSDESRNVAVPGTSAYRASTAAAVMEWILIFCFINYLLALSLGSCHGFEIRAVLSKAAAETRIGAKAPSEGRSMQPQSTGKRVLRFLRNMVW